MSDAPGEYWPHPLMPWLENIAVNSRHLALVQYAPLEEFKARLDLAGIVHPLYAEDEAKRNILMTYQHSAALLFVIAAGGGSDLGGEELHALLYTAAETDPFALALCNAAAAALRLGFLPSFTVATRLPGFMSALEAWARHFEYDKPFSGPDRLLFVNRDMSGDDFWLKACQNDYPSVKDFMRALCREQELFEDAKRKSQERKDKLMKKGKTPRPPAIFKDRIAFGWLPLSLWARTSAGISFLLEPRGDAAEKAEKRVQRDINELKFSASHCGDLEIFINRADKVGKNVPDN
jgi:hypothetical protein